MVSPDSNIPEYLGVRRRSSYRPIPEGTQVQSLDYEEATDKLLRLQVRQSVILPPCIQS